MRGEPGDAMARMKRWEAVRQRLADANGHSAHTVDEVVHAVSEVARHHEDLTVTVTVDDGGELSTVRIVQRAGQLDVTRLQPQPLATPLRPTSPSHLATPPPPSPLATPAPTSPAPPPPSDPRWHGDSPWAGQTLRPDQGGAAPQARVGGAGAQAAAGAGSGGRQDQSGTRAGSGGRQDWQRRDPETLDQTAARLAELIRQDPSLLDGNG